MTGNAQALRRRLDEVVRRRVRRFHKAQRKVGVWRAQAEPGESGELCAERCEKKGGDVGERRSEKSQEFLSRWALPSSF